MQSAVPNIETTDKGAIVWFTGLPNSGKSQLARRVQGSLAQRSVACCVLDGDRVRDLLRPRPGYSSQERDDFYVTLGNVALELAQQGLVVLVPATAHRRHYRDRVRAQAPRFVEVWMTASVEECRTRDKTKGLYAQFASGQLHGLPGEDSSYEAPESADVLATGGEDVAALQCILQSLSTRPA